LNQVYSILCSVLDFLAELLGSVIARAGSFQQSPTGFKRSIAYPLLGSTETISAGLLLTMLFSCNRSDLRPKLRNLRLHHPTRLRPVEIHQRLSKTFFAIMFPGSIYELLSQSR
jgi:hypothetical protein